MNEERGNFLEFHFHDLVVVLQTEEGEKKSKSETF